MTGPSSTRETIGVLHVLIGVAVAALLAVGVERARAAAGAQAAAGAGVTDAVPFARLAPADQRLVRRLREGLGEIERLRSRRGRWPLVAALAADGIPPFAPDPIDPAGYQWRMVRAGTTINYVGRPTAAPQRPALLAVLIEPAPGTPRDPTAPQDDVHHRLADGTMLHVFVWTGPSRAALAAAVAAPPVEDGWRRVTLRGP